ncbi:MAG: hypothetical protein LBL41_04555 [Bifidobacteriaceae bacterium]|jgi:hypothetical protein|nr:hypothetical protein [Bifidobacteriaceae bacterium]
MTDEKQEKRPLPDYQPTVSANQTAPQPQTQKRKINVKLIATIGAVAIVVIGGFVGYNIYQETQKHASPSNALKAYIEALDANDYAKALEFTNAQEGVSASNIVTLGEGKFPEITIVEAVDVEPNATTAELSIKLGESATALPAIPFIKVDNIGWVLKNLEFLNGFTVCESSESICALDSDLVSLNTSAGDVLTVATPYYYSKFQIADDADYKDSITVKFQGTNAWKPFEQKYSEIESDSSIKLGEFTDDFAKSLTALAEKVKYDTFSCKGSTEIEDEFCTEETGYEKTIHITKPDFDAQKDCKLSPYTGYLAFETNFATYNIWCNFEGITDDDAKVIEYKNNVLFCSQYSYAVDSTKGKFTYFSEKITELTESVAIDESVPVKTNENDYSTLSDTDCSSIAGTWENIKKTETTIVYDDCRVSNNGGKIVSKLIDFRIASGFFKTNVAKEVYIFRSTMIDPSSSTGAAISTHETFYPPGVPAFADDRSIMEYLNNIPVRYVEVGDSTKARAMFYSSEWITKDNMENYHLQYRNDSIQVKEKK